MKRIMSLLVVLLSLAILIFMGIKVAVKAPEYVSGVYVGNSVDILNKYGLIDENADEYINTVDALKVFMKIYEEDFGGSWISSWYSIDELEMLDETVDEDIKKLLMELYYEAPYFLTVEDIIRLDYSADMTEYDALLFAVRLIGDTYYCVDQSAEYGYRTKEEVYSKAKEKGLIGSKKSHNAEKPILREKFYDIVCRAIHTEYSSGGMAGAMKVKHVDYLEKRLNSEKSETTVTTQEIEIPFKWNDDFSLSIEMPLDLKNDDFDEKITAYTQSGRKISAIAYGGKPNGIAVTSAQLCEMVAKAYPEKLKEIEICYYKYDFERHTKEEYILKIDTSNIDVIREGDSPKVDTYIRNKGQWPVQELSLKDGQLFKAGHYYTIVGKQHKYRKEKYNDTSYATFKNYTEQNTVSNFGNLGSFGAMYLDEIRLIEIKAEKTGADKFKVTVSPISEDMFKVIEK